MWRSAVSKRSNVKHRTNTDGPNPRQPCPCGSGKRYKACHGAKGGPGDTVATRPFQGLVAECELIALREFVPSATVTLPVEGSRQVLLGTVLPMVVAALVRSADQALVGAQTQTRSGDVSRDLGGALRWALTAEPGEVLPTVPTGGAGTDDGGDRLQDLLPVDADLRPEIHADFGWWIPEGTEASGDVALALERANAAVLPTRRLEADGVRAAYWADAGDTAHLRWVRPEPEDQLLAALARLSMAGGLDFGEGSRFAGSFRAHGVLVPVWDLDPESHPQEWEKPVVEFNVRLDEALASTESQPLSESERRAVHGLRGRQVTLR